MLLGILVAFVKLLTVFGAEILDDDIYISLAAGAGLYKRCNFFIVNNILIVDGFGHGVQFRILQQLQGLLAQWDIFEIGLVFNGLNHKFDFKIIL